MLHALGLAFLAIIFVVNLEGFFSERREKRDMERMYGRPPETFWQAYMRELL